MLNWKDCTRSCEAKLRYNGSRTSACGLRVKRRLKLHIGRRGASRGHPKCRSQPSPREPAQDGGSTFTSSTREISPGIARLWVASGAGGSFALRNKSRLLVILLVLAQAIPSSACLFLSARLPAEAAGELPASPGPAPGCGAFTQNPTAPFPLPAPK